jgi:hypothetical protein
MPLMSLDRKGETVCRIAGFDVAEEVEPGSGAGRNGIEPLMQ